MEAKTAEDKLVLVVGRRRAYLVEVVRGKKKRVASFDAGGVVWWRELFGALELDNSWGNMHVVSKAYLFAKIYPYAESPATLVRLLREMDDFEAVYWALAVQRFGARGIYAFKYLFGV